MLGCTEAVRHWWVRLGHDITVFRDPSDCRWGLGRAQAVAGKLVGGSVIHCVLWLVLAYRWEAPALDIVDCEVWHVLILVLACCGQTQAPGSLAAGPWESWGRDWCTDVWGCTLGPLQAECAQSFSCVQLCDPMDYRPDCSPPGSSVHRDSPRKITGMGCHALLQRIFPTQGSNPGIPHCR